MKHFIPFFKDFKQTGAIAPSSIFLAKEMVEQIREALLDEDCPPLSILEIGAGTGPFTKEIIRLLRPQDHLDIVEIHERFYRVISSRYEKPNVSIHHADIIHFEPSRNYDFILSGLPYENIPPEISNRIWSKMIDLCTDGAFISYFKYVKFRKFRNPFEEQIVTENLKSRKTVYLNLPPAYVYTVEVSGHTRELLREMNGTPGRTRSAQ